MAKFYFQLDEKEKPLDNLEKGLEKRDSELPLVNADFNFDSLRTEKRFINLMQKIRLAK